MTVQTAVVVPALAVEVNAGTPPMQERNRFLDGVERLGNALPDPALIFVGMIAVLMAVSAVGAAAGWSALNPVTGETLSVTSLLSEQSLQLLITETPRTFAAFAPLGLVLTIMLGAGVADRSGLFAALVRASLSVVHEARARARGDVDGHADLPCRRFRLCRLTCRWPASSSPARDGTPSWDS